MSMKAAYPGYLSAVTGELATMKYHKMDKTTHARPICIVDKNEILRIIEVCF